MEVSKYIEHTQLNPGITSRDIDKLVTEALEHNFLGICIPPFWIKKASRELENTNIKLVSVVGFPLGYQSTETKLKECQVAIDNGVHELDIVMNISAFKSGMPWTKIELAKCSQLLHDNNIQMKVILETALLDESEIIEATKLVVDSGTDFVKTSTGFSSYGARLEDVRLIKQTIPSHVGIKASGGIKSYQQLKVMIESGATRIGTSSGVAIMQELATND